MSYGDLTEAEQHHWDAYATLRAITDWEAFSEAQENRKLAERDWLVNQRKTIWRAAEGRLPDYEPGWDVNNRAARYEQLKDDSLNNATAKHEYTLPAGGCTPSEKVYIEEREGWLMIGGDGASADDAQKARKVANSDWLVARRKEVWHLINDPGGSTENDRELRYQNLCIATHHGEAWEAYESTHNKYGKEITSQPGGSSRSDCKRWLESYLGVSENPPNSNRGNPQPDGWSIAVYGSSGVPWCANFAVSSAWSCGVDGSGTASVWNNTQLAKNGQGIYKGYTTDPSKIHAGDHAFIGDDHTGVVYDVAAGTTIEGNTSPGSEGSQYNGGCVAKRTRGWGYWSGFGIVRFPDD